MRYEKPRIEAVVFQTEDVIRTSDGLEIGGPGTDPEIPVNGVQTDLSGW